MHLFFTYTVEVDSTTAVVTELQLSMISDDVGNCWRKLGPRLEIDASKIRNIDDDYSTNRDKANALLIKWKEEKGSSALVGRLADHLKEIGRKDTAEKLLGKQQCFKTEWLLHLKACD